MMSLCPPHQERGPDVPLEILPDEGRGPVTTHGDQRHVVQRAREEPPVAAGNVSKLIIQILVKSLQQKQTSKAS